LIKLLSPINQFVKLHNLYTKVLIELENVIHIAPS